MHAHAPTMTQARTCQTIAPAYAVPTGMANAMIASISPALSSSQSSCCAAAEASAASAPSSGLLPLAGLAARGLPSSLQAQHVATSHLKPLSLAL